MPITSEQMTYEEMKRVVSNPRYRCGECDGILNLAWGGSLGYNGYILRCGNDVKHGTITKYNRESEEFMAETREQSDQSSVALMAMTETAMVERVDKAKFVKDLSQKEKVMLAVACITYGFDPIMHELTIFQGNPFVSVDGRYRKAQETGKLDGMECRPATKQERIDWEIPEGDKFCRAECYVKGAARPFVGWGRVFEKEMAVRQGNPGDAYKPIVTNPLRMAEKRAEVQALRKAFHIPLPSSEYIGMIQDGEQYAETAVGKVEKATGLVVEEAKPEAEPEESAVAGLAASGKDDRLITEEQATELTLIMGKAEGFGMQEFGRFCNKEMGWGIHKMGDLKVWQLENLKTKLQKSIDHNTPPASLEQSVK